MMLSCKIRVPEENEHVPAKAFAESAAPLSPIERDGLIADTLLGGHVPSHMRAFVDVSIAFNDKAKKAHTLVLRVLPDYLTIGTDADWVRVPMSPLAAQRVCDEWDCMMPTVKIVQLIWAAGQKTAPKPWGPPYDHSMQSLDRVFVHNERINKELNDAKLDPTKLLSGHKKDVVVSNRHLSQPKQVAIFGWIQLNGKEIQPLSLVHEAQYADYSHGIRLVSKGCILDGQETELATVLQDAQLHVGVSLEGPLKVLRQPGT